MSRELDGRERSALLERMGLADPAPTVACLLAVQRAWCLTQPFHNLDLLAARGGGGRALDPDEAIERCIAGLGGPCHVQAAGLLALLRSVGFDAHLAPATIQHDADHLGVTVHLEGLSYWCDPGNGQPYMIPFPTDRDFEQSHLGWSVRSEVRESALTVRRRSFDAPASRRVYEARPLVVRTWEDFAASIARHHSEPGFGPFITGLRIVRIGEQRMITLRDHTLTEYDRDGFSRRELTYGQLASVIVDGLGLGALPFGKALAAWRDARGEE